MVCRALSSKKRQGQSGPLNVGCKGEICDSTGRRSVEFDIIISYLSSAIRLFGTAINQVLPIESVLAVLEVKSILAKESVTTFNSNLAHLNTFDRYYVPTLLYKHIGPMFKGSA